MYDELIVGDRGWGLAERSGRFVLESTYAPDIWTKKVMTSECRCDDTYYRFIVPHECLFNDVHSCGLVSLKPDCNLINGTIYGTIAQFGRVQEFKYGHRSQFAFITALYEDVALCDTCWTDEYMNGEFAEDNPYLVSLSGHISLATMIGQRLGEWRSLYCAPHAAERKTSEVLYSYPEVVRSLALTYDVPLILRGKNHEQ